MKKVAKKLTLSRETVANLIGEELEKAAGGITQQCFPTTVGGRLCVSCVACTA